MSNIFDEWKWRGMLYDHTEGVDALLGKEKIAVYNGFDPTAPSLHIGNLLPMVGLARLQRFGHHPIALAGGGTGMIGDPSGRSTERNLLSADVLAYNVERIKVQLAGLLDFEVKSNPARLVNNLDWLSQLSMIDYLRDVGKHFTINYMLAKDSVQNRIEREDGLSYTEFSYMLLQAYDFLHLHNTYNCQLQVGGSDQWGNITAGIPLIRKARGHTAHGAVYPLLTRGDGTKFGKTADGQSVWLDPAQTSPYRFYQFLFNTEDSKVGEMMRFYTFLSQQEIAEYEQLTADHPERREAQRCLAQEVTRLVHGDSGVSKAEQATHVLFGGEISGLAPADIEDIFAEAPSTTVARNDFENGGIALSNMMVTVGAAKSNGEARRLIGSGGVYLNNVRQSDERGVVSLDTSIAGQFLVLRKGKKEYFLVKIQGN